MQQTVGLIFLSLVVLGALACLGAHFRNRAACRDAASWPRVPARIIKSEFHEAISQRGVSRGLLDLRYEYSWNQRPYVSSRINFNDAPLSKSQIHAIREKYRLDREYPVYVNPNRPDQAALELAEPGTGLLTLAAILFLAAVINGAILLLV